MEKRYLLCLAMLSVLLFSGALLPASSIASEAGQGSLEAQATHVLVGKVKAIESSWNEEKRLVYSHVTVTVEKVLKGTVRNNEVVVRHEGGEVGDIGQWTEHEPSFKRGEKVKLYLKQATDGAYRVVGGTEGKISLEAEEVTSPGYNWQGHRWLVLPVKYYFSPYSAPTGALTAVQASFLAWEDDPGSYIDYTYLGTRYAPVGKDGYNIVLWDVIDGAGGTLAVCTFWYVVATKEIVEFDIQFDEADSWQVWENTAGSTSFDVQNVGTHEAGHSLGLLDLYDLADVRETMYGYSRRGETTKRTLYTGDLQGLKVIYPMPVPYNLGVTVRTDKAVYKPGWPVQLSLRITTEVARTTNFWWALNVGGQFITILYAPGLNLPAEFDMVLDIDFTVPNLGSTAFPAAWVAVIIDPATGNILAWDYSLWTYSPASSTAPVVTPGEFAAQIANSTRLPP